MPEPKHPRNASQPSSVDPTELLSRLDHSAAPDAIEPTVILRRDDLRRPASGSDRTVVEPPKARTRPIPERPSRPPAGPRPAAPSRPARAEPGPGLWQRLTAAVGGGGRRRPASVPAHGSDPRRPAGLSPTAKGALFALGGVVLAVFAVLGVIGVFRWLWPAEPTTTVTKNTPENPAVTTSIPVTTTPSTTWTMTIYRPEHGTVFVEGTSITCGSRGDKCAAELEDGFPVVLRQEPDATYQFLRYTGQCGDNGEVNMTKPLACSATFQKAVAANDKPAPAAPLPPGPPRPLNPGGTRGTPALPTAAQDHGNAAPGGNPDKSPKPDIEPPPPPPSGGAPVVAGEPRHLSVPRKSTRRTTSRCS